MEAASRSAVISLLKAAWPAASVQVFPPNSVVICRSATLPRRRSSACGTSGVRRSAASGTPNQMTPTIETAAAIDQPTIFPIPR